MALVCMALAERGIPAASFTGSQAGIITDDLHTKARIIEVKGDRIREALGGRVGAGGGGFPGCVDGARRDDARPRRLRHDGGGPRGCPRGRPLRDLHRRLRACSPPTPASCRRPASCLAISFEEMLEIAATGGRVLALRSVEFARNHHVTLARPLVVHLGAGHARHRGGSRYGATRRLCGDQRHVVGQDHALRRRWTGRASPPPCSEGWRTAPSTST